MNKLCIALLLLTITVPALACAADTGAASVPGTTPEAGSPSASMAFEVSALAPGPEIGTANVASAHASGSELLATSIHGEVVVRLRRFSYYCSPAPSFTATRVGDTLRLTLTTPDAVSRCVTLHDQALSFGDIDRGAWLERVVIVDASGHERVAGDVVRAR